MVMPRFAQVRRAICTRDVLVISCWLASNAFLLISFLGRPSDNSGAGAIFAWIVLLAFGLLWIVEAACRPATASPKFRLSFLLPYDLARARRRS
jgi:hypothetical protein